MHHDHITRPAIVALPKRTKDLAGLRFGRLVATGYVGRSSTGRLMWLCDCDCGNFTEVDASNLRTGRTSSCGCGMREAVADRARTHGLCDHPLYNTWWGMVHRCTNPKATNYHSYGGRGIGVCEEWATSPAVFFEYISKLPDCQRPGYSIDRIDNDGNYEPGNVRWSTMSEQNRNKRTNLKIAYCGKTQCLSEWAEELNISYTVLRHRLAHSKWDVGRAFTTPVGS